MSPPIPDSRPLSYSPRLADAAMLIQHVILLDFCHFQQSKLDDGVKQLLTHLPLHHIASARKSLPS